MKFSHSLILNAVPDWIEYYIDYDHLKKIVYRIERIKVQQQVNDSHDVLTAEQRLETGHAPPMPATTAATIGGEEGQVSSDDAMFLKELDKQLDKIIEFYHSKSNEILQDASTLREQFESFGISLSVINDEDERGGLDKLDSTGQGYHQTSPALNHSLTTDDVTEHDTEGHDEERQQQQQTQQQQPLRKSRTFSVLQPSQPFSEKGGSPAPPAATAWPRRSNSVSTALSMRHRRRSSGQPRQALPRRRRSMAVRDQLQQQVWQNQPNSGMMDNDVSTFNQYYNFRARCAATYISLAELKQYVDINKLGFDKILKKWDKVTGSNLRKTYYDKVIITAPPFISEQHTELENAINLVRDMYAAVFTNGDIHAALSELKLHMRDHIQFERTTVWKDMVGKERMTMDAHAADVQEGYHLPYGLFVTKRALRHFVFFLMAVVPFAVFMSIDVLDDVPASKCLGLLLLAAIMWALECIPIYATAYVMPLLIPPMDVMKENGQVVGAKKASELVFSSMFNGTVMVLLGSFAIAAALSKHGIARAFASVVLSRAGTKPSIVILVNMYLAVFLSMWISNVATPVLCTTLVEPILRTLPPRSPVGPCLILAIALASCVGGLTSPISSPQNIITITILKSNPDGESAGSWGNWFAVALPVAVISVLTTWAFLLLYFRPDRAVPRLNSIRGKEIALPNVTQLFVCVVCLATIGLWCGESAMSDFWGDNGVIAAIPFVLFFGTGVLSKTDLNNFSWGVIIVFQGGLALAAAVESSGLLQIIGLRIAAGVDHLSALAIIFIFGMIVLMFATFVSHTVAALIILPIVQQVGERLAPPHPNLLVTVTGLVCSLGMALPISGFPNMNAFMQEDPTGKPYLTVKDFVIVGVPSSICAGVITILLGYGIVVSMVSD